MSLIPFETRVCGRSLLKNQRRRRPPHRLEDERDCGGGVEEVSDTIGRYRDLGVGELIVPDFTLGRRDRKLETLDRFIEDVASRFR